MITHFQCKPLYSDASIPGWTISFFSNKQYYQAIYHKDGQIEWTSLTPVAETEEEYKKAIHELMLFHVYE